MDKLNVIILCGGQGSRVKDYVKGVPKILIPRDGIAHLTHLYSQICKAYPTSNIFLATGIGYDQISQFVVSNQMSVTISNEVTPLGTGGAVLKCMKDFSLQKALVINGDTIYSSLPPANDLSSLRSSTLFVSKKASRDRFGAVNFLDDGNVEFLSKGDNEVGFVSTGIYYLTFSVFQSLVDTSFLSLEDDIVGVYKFNYQPIDLQFQDFGVPDDIVKYTDIESTNL